MLKHPNIVQIVDTIENDSYVKLILEYGGISLKKYMSNVGNSL